MRKAWLIPLLFLLGCSPPDTRPNVYLAHNEFSVMCRHIEATTEYDCGDLSVPIVVITKLMSYMGLNGGNYNGEDILFIAPQEDMFESQTSVILHETAHYILWMRGIARDRCKSESLARQWTAEILEEEIDPTWIERYECIGRL